MSHYIEFCVCLTYLMRKFPLRCIWAFRVDGDLAVLFSCDNWLALVRGNRGDGLPVPGRTGGVHTTTTLWNAQNQTITNKPMAIKAFIVLESRTLFWSLRFFQYYLLLFYIFCSFSFLVFVEFIFYLSFLSMMFIICRCLFRSSCKTP